MTKRAVAETNAAKYVHEQAALHARGEAVTLPRVVTEECDSGEPHYLMYLTQDEIVDVLATMAEDASGYTMPTKKVLCGPPQRLKR